MLIQADKLEFDEENERMKKLITFVFSFIVLCLGGCNNNAASIGIIGGADGPTAILVTSTINWPGILGLIGVIIVISVALIIYLNKKKK